MTEIPEHLLKRSKERRSALGLPGGEGGDGGSGDGGSGDAPTEAAASAPAKAAAPAKVEEKPPPPPKPKPAYIQAAEKRKRIPYWAMSLLVLLPVWGFIYAEGVTEPEQADEVVTIGEEVYGSCAGCHGGGGEGGTGAQLSDGEVLATFPDPVAMMQWIHLGGDAWAEGTDGTYGDPDREGGPHNTGDLSSNMPPFPDLDAEELAYVTRYVREQLSGEVSSEAAHEQYVAWAEEAIERAEAGDIIYKGGVEPDEERIAEAAGG